jgi:hypothetical protein
MPYVDPERGRQYQREYRRTRRAGDSCTTPCTTLLPLEFRLRTASDVLDLLEEQVDAVVKDANSTALEKARCIGFLCGVTLRAIEAGELAARLEAVEAVLKNRKNGETKP